jgi:hypothetical protein
MIKLGTRVKDAITGFEGIATSRAEYLYGCVRVLVEPQILKDGKPVEALWLDELRFVDGPGDTQAKGGPTLEPSRQTDAPR